MKKLLVYILLCLLTINSFAVKPPVKFGKIDIADLKMITYEHDTSAVAVVLCEYGRFDGPSFTFSTTIRIKILKKEGLGWANHVFWGYSKTSVRGITYNLENGVITRDKLKNESVFKLHIADDWHNISIAMPNVKVGSVIDIQYSFQGLPYRWYFQRSIPVLWSELVMIPSPNVKFRKNYYGYIPFYKEEDNRWITKNVPALKTEPYTNSIQNYITKFELELTSVHFPGVEEHHEKYYMYRMQYSKSFAATWESVSRNLYYHENFGNTLFTTAFLIDVASDITARTKNKIKQLELAHKEITKIKWDKDKKLYTTYKNLSTTHNKQIGNSTDINLMLVALLRKLGFEAYPVVMCTRDRGICPPYPTKTKLNYTICLTIIDGKEYLIDATSELLPFTLLPEHCLNNRGQAILAEEKVKEVIISPGGEDIKNTMLKLSINDDFTLSGTLIQKYSEYGAYQFRKEYETVSDQNEFIENIENQNPGLIIKSITIENLDSIYNDINQESQITYTKGISKVGNNLYLTPLLSNSLTKNPFKIENRLYPVDFMYPRSNSVIVQYCIPDGYEIEEVPKPMKVALPNNSALVNYSISQMENAITIIYQFKINKVMFLPSEYAGLKQLYSMIIDKHAEPIILKKL